MATLNIKAFPDRLYRKLQARAKRERRSMAQEVTHLLDAALSSTEPLSLLDLQGRGKTIWKGVEAGAHIRRERKAWD